MHFHLFSQAQCLHSYKQSIHLKVLISSTCVPRESNEMQRNGCVTSDTSLWQSVSHIPSPVLAPLRSPSALPSGSGLWLHLSPSFSPLSPTWLALSISYAAALPSSPPDPDPAEFWHPSSQNLWLLESSSHAWWFQPEARMPPGLYCSLGLLPFTGSCTSIHAFLPTFSLTFIPSLPLSYLPWSSPS